MCEAAGFSDAATFASGDRKPPVRWGPAEGGSCCHRGKFKGLRGARGLQHDTVRQKEVIGLQVFRRKKLKSAVHPFTCSSEARRLEDHPRSRLGSFLGGTEKQSEEEGRPATVKENVV
ncbi:hypothetical protein AGIG_G11148 [Arapaima gigas]